MKKTVKLKWEFAEYCGVLSGVYGEPEQNNFNDFVQNVKERLGLQNWRYENMMTDAGKWLLSLVEETFQNISKSL
ncbi:MAG: hypothetical protein AOA65_1300 [Candidatus Bathyarchaeota archaeon BA1]|nr:MAG: hypothetical protein AOA65_1300 [Candidatus Bathyarchaeota archaeon BA1]